MQREYEQLEEQNFQNTRGEFSPVRNNFDYQITSKIMEQPTLLPELCDMPAPPRQVPSVRSDIPQMIGRKEMRDTSMDQRPMSMSRNNFHDYGDYDDQN